MKNRIQKWGNSLAVRVPKSFAAELGWRENTPVAMSLDEGALVIKTDRTRVWDLGALIEGITDENAHPAWEAELPAPAAGAGASTDREADGEEAGG